ncbi:MAG: NINE protein [Gemmataceae bacterium]
MIRFACPGCSATFAVDPSKAGKAGKCPKCGTQFLIPEATVPEPASAGATPPPLPPVPATNSVEIDPCPKCQTKLSVAKSDIGSDVGCPYCETVFTAVEVKPIRLAPPEPPPPPPPRSRYRDRDRDRDRDEVDDDRPRKSRRGRRDDDEDEYDDDRPRRNSRRRRTNIESKRVMAGVLALLLGGLGVHKFYLGYTNAGLLTLLLNFCTFGVGGIIAFVEGIIYLTKTDEEFIEIYQIGTKEWF